MSSPMTVTVEESSITVVSVAEQGPAGTIGATGATGSAGPGVASGGSSGQFLVKNSGTDYDTGWSDISLSSDVTGMLPLTNGGTGAGTARAAQAALKGVYILAASAVAVSVTGTTSETTLADITIPANSMGANGVVRVTTGWSHTNSGNNKTLRVRFGDTNFGNSNITSSATTRDQRQIHNRNATNSQVGMSSTLGGFTSSGVSPITASVDTTSDVSLIIAGQLANSGETISLEYYLVELIVP